jgi:hypothetical protein
MALHDTLQALGIKSQQIKNLKWVERLKSQTSDRVGAYVNSVSPEEAREMRDLVLEVNLKPTKANG